MQMARYSHTNSLKMHRSETGTYRTFLYPALEMLEDTFRRRQITSEEDYHMSTTMKLEFRFFKMFFWGLDHWQVSQEYDCHLRSVTSTMRRKFWQIHEEFQNHVHVQCEWRESFDSTKQVFLRWQKRIKPYKQQVKEICILLLHGEIRCKSCHQNLQLFLKYGKETASFIEFLLDNLEALSSKFHLIAPVKQQIHFITGKLKALGKFGDPVPYCPTRVKILGELLSQTQTWANHLSCLACLYWIDHGMDETLVSTMGTMLSDVMHKTTSSTAGVIASCFEGSLIPQLLARYFDFLLEELALLPANDGIEILQERLIFLLSFMMHPPEEDSEHRELILEQIYSMINGLSSLSCSMHSNEMEDRISQTKLSDFLQRISGVEAEVRKLYAITPRSAQFNSPRTNAIGFLDSLLQKLEKWLEVNLIVRVKHGIQTVWEELASLRPFMQHLTELQNEQEELKNIWNRIVDVVYYAAYVTNLCAAKSFSIWFGIICLPSVIEEIKVIKNEVREINDPQMCKSKMLSIEMEFRNTMLPRTTTSNVEGAFIGFKEETKSIIDHLIGGGTDLTIISISGMPGQGKTTLAKRIYNDSKIQCRFHKTMWSYVSKECKIRDLMIHLVRDASETVVGDISNVEIQDLAERLRKFLKGRRYLIVMDDIWDRGVWCQVQSSFPNDKNGSRILFTSRNLNLKSQGERNFISYPLRSFSQEESWGLMKEKLNGLGTEFEVIGKEIAKSCKGLPLAVAIVASLLGKTEQKLELWNQVAENLESHLGSEECMHIIDLSYKYLPEHLKPCFLYFGAFPRGKNIRAKRLKLLWIAEGFIKGNEMRYSEDLAEECLDYLVSQSLVVVAKKSSMGGIKRCNVHDLIYDLCLRKITEDNFLHWIDQKTIRDECRSSPQKYGHHRLCLGKIDPFMEARPICGRELPTSPVESLLWFDRPVGVTFAFLWSFHFLKSFDFLKSFKVLTVLDLEDVGVQGDVFPEVILCNIYLKYLALWGSFKNIPPSIANLWNLETLILTCVYCRRVIVPTSMWSMKSLRHVIIKVGYVSLEDFEGNESYVAALDNNNIETLGGLSLGIDHQRTVEFLGRMTSLRKLKCHFFRDTMFSIFKSLENLEELKFDGHFNDLIFETCSSPQNKNLRKLSLEDLEIASWSVLSTIGNQFPNLEVLKLYWVKCKGSRTWDLEDGEFSNLKYLKLGRLDDLKEINVSDDSDNPFPCLEVLIVEQCRSLKEIPSEIGEIGSLKTIKMNWSSRKASESVMQILEQQRDLGNHSLQVFVTDIYPRGRYYDDEETEGKAEAIEEDESDNVKETEKKEEDKSFDDAETEEVVESNLKKNDDDGSNIELLREQWSSEESEEQE